MPMRKRAKMRSSVLKATLPGGAEETFVNVNDGTCEGITYHDRPAFTVQFHPEACAGPKDTEELFGRFITMMREYKEKKQPEGEGSHRRWRQF